MDHDIYSLYEACVQSPPEMTALLRAIHGNNPKILAEDFSGTGALCRYWAEHVDGGRAIAVDRNPEPLSRLQGASGVEIVQADVMQANAKADCLFAGNFSIGYHHSRPALLAYLKHVRERLNPGGTFVCDTYGGETAYTIGRVIREVPLPGSQICKYQWEQRYADPLTGRVTDVLHFRVFEGDEVIADFPDAFIYEWRLWSVPELRDAMAESGFHMSDVYAELPDAVDDQGNVYAEPITDPEWIGDNFIVCVAGRLG
ncbi:MAG TPA: class I SAM-dependent methyltransferase [Phycisphaerales bacterium]|nr:class I SAM-dependent methyltransferase [Phycisphaerales bacterium]